MSKAKQAEVPAIYPLKGENKKPEHVKPDFKKMRLVNKIILYKQSQWKYQKWRNILKFQKCMNKE